MKGLKFYDVSAKKGFTTSKYALKTKSGRKFAVATAPSGASAYRVMPKK